ncbi:MAG: hypothetical protein WAK60_10990 [Sedimentisphaerales bacterium]
MNKQKLCETNPISEKPKIDLTYYMTKNYENKPELFTMQKQTQNKPKFTRHSVWRAKPILPAMAGKIAPLFRVLFILMGPASGGKLAGKEFKFFDAQAVS